MRGNPVGLGDIASVGRLDRSGRYFLFEVTIPIVNIDQKVAAVPLSSKLLEDIYGNDL